MSELFLPDDDSFCPPKLVWQDNVFLRSRFAVVFGVSMKLLTYATVRRSLDHFENRLMSKIGSRLIPESVVASESSNNGRSGLANLTVFDGV